MTRFSTRLATALALGLTLLPALASAQRLGAAVGYTSMPGLIGDFESDRGVALRLGVDLIGGGIVSWGLEGGVDRLNQIHRTFTEDCIVPGGGTDSCLFDRRSRDTGWSLGTILRAGVPRGPVRPYVLVGVGVMTVRTRESNRATDSSGNPLPNFESDGNYGDDALQGHLGAGLAFRPRGLPVSLTVEGRATLLLNNYSGGPQGNWNPSVTVGVRTGR